MGPPGHSWDSTIFSTEAREERFLLRRAPARTLTRRAFLAISLILFLPPVTVLSIVDLLNRRTQAVFLVLTAVGVFLLSFPVIKKAPDIRWGHGVVAFAVMALLIWSSGCGGWAGVWLPLVLLSASGLLLPLRGKGGDGLDAGYLAGGLHAPSHQPGRGLSSGVVIPFPGHLNAHGHAIPGPRALKNKTPLSEAADREGAELAQALSKVQVLTGLLPICASRKSIRDDEGYWTRLETYISDHSDPVLSHGVFPSCKERLYPGLFDSDGEETN
jgi:hypothetical protein